VSWLEWAASERARIIGGSRWRTLPAPETGLVSFASNDYLGLSGHPAVLAAAHDALDRWGAGSGSARLIAGSRPVHERLERALAAWTGTEAAVLLPAGYMANLAAVTAFASPDTLVLSDELNHASIIDACRLARAEVRVYPHLAVDAVEGHLRSGRRALVLTESVFSMDGDVAPLSELVEVCARHDALLVLDEAHAVLGPEPPPSPLLLRVGTLSKTLGSAGGFVSGPAWLVDLAVNRARPFIFTTAVAPAAAAAAMAALDVLRGAEGERLRSRLRANVDTVAPGHRSPIIPVVTGGEDATLQRARALRDAGLLVPAIRPPTVPAGTSRLRISISALHTEEELQLLKSALPELAAVAA
jgi:8-amino-7-oxononanoate synthase